MAGGVQAAGYYHNADALEMLRLAYDRDDPEAKAAYFRGYVAGVADSTRDNAWCPPGDVKPEQTYDMVSKYMKNYSPTANQGAVAVVTAALASNFPCRSK
jgi:hypothetical protein